jgi:hypothetical protein
MTKRNLYAIRESLKAAEAIAVNDDEWGRIVDKRLAVEDEILGLPVTNPSEIAVKLRNRDATSRNL